MRSIRTKQYADFLILLICLFLLLTGCGGKGEIAQEIQAEALPVESTRSEPSLDPPDAGEYNSERIRELFDIAIKRIEESEWVHVEEESEPRRAENVHTAIYYHIPERTVWICYLPGDARYDPEQPMWNPYSGFEPYQEMIQNIEIQKSSLSDWHRRSWWIERDQERTTLQIILSIVESDPQPGVPPPGYWSRQHYIFDMDEGYLLSYTDHWRAAVPGGGAKNIYRYEYFDESILPEEIVPR